MHPKVKTPHSSSHYHKLRMESITVRFVLVQKKTAVIIQDHYSQITILQHKYCIQNEMVYVVGQ